MKLVKTNLRSILRRFLPFLHSMLRIVLVAMVGLVLAVGGAASGKWIWRDNRWVREADEEEGAEPAPERGVPGVEPMAIPETPPTARPTVSGRRRIRLWPPGVVREKDIDLFREAKIDYRNERFRAASRKFKRIIKHFPTSPYREEAMWLRAEALFARKAYYTAFFQYEELLKEYAGTPHFADALKREFQIAEIYFGPTRRKFLGIPLFSGDEEAVEILRKVYEHQPSGELADVSVLKIADYSYNLGLWLEAEHYYAKYAQDFADREHARKALSRAGQCAIAQCKGPLYDTSTLVVARDRLRKYQALYPEEKEKVAATLARIREVDAEKEYRVACYYRRAGHPDTAAFYAERVIRNYADTSWAKRARELIGEMSYKGGRKK